jgi:hypothetical protein
MLECAESQKKARTRLPRIGKLGHDVFCDALLKPMSGEARVCPKTERSDGKGQHQTLEAYINNQVPEVTKLYRGKRQES